MILNFIDLILCLTPFRYCCWNNIECWIALTGMILSFFGGVLSFIGVWQVIRVRKDIAYNQVKLKQVEVMSNLLRHLNQVIVQFIYCEFGDDGETKSQEYYQCNIFEIGVLINEKPQETALVSLNYGYSMLFVDNYLINGFIDNDVANALAVFDPRTSIHKMENGVINGKTVILIYNKEKRMGQSTQEMDLYEICNDKLNTVAVLKESIRILENTIRKWYRKNGINDCNIQINLNNIKPLMKK